MRTSELLIRAAAQSGITACFMNPGTTELPLVEAFDATDGIRPVLCLFEGVATGAADGYSRMSGNPGLTVLHLGPGYANGIANLHNARRGQSGILNLIGEHATWHLSADPPLAMPIARLAEALPGHVRTVGTPSAMGPAFLECHAAAASGQISHMILPHDVQLAETDTPIPKPASGLPMAPSSETVEKVAKALSEARNPAILLGGPALTRTGIQYAARVAGKTGATLLEETFTPRAERGAGIHAPIRIPYLPENAIALLAPFDLVLLVGARSPVSFFGYPGIAGRFVREDQKEVLLASPHADCKKALLNLCDEIGAMPSHAPSPPAHVLPERPTGKLDGVTLGQAVAAMQPEHVIVMDEGITSGFFYHPLAEQVAPHTRLSLTGGAIGMGIPAAIGAAIACPDRPVLSFQADGSGLYTVQGLWTQAREGLDIKTVICANHSYDILKVEIDRSGNVDPGPFTKAMTRLDGPRIDWVSIATGFGVPALRATTADELVAALARAFAEPGPFLIEACLAP